MLEVKDWRLATIRTVEKETREIIPDGIPKKRHQSFGARSLTGVICGCDAGYAEIGELGGWVGRRLQK